MFSRRRSGPENTDEDTDSGRSRAIVADEPPEEVIEVRPEDAARETFRRQANEALSRPPKIAGPVGFINRMTFETDLLTTIYQIKSTYISWGYTSGYDYRTYYWFLAVARLFLMFLSSQGQTRPTLSMKWQAMESRVPFLERPMEMMELALAEANRLGLTLRSKQHAFKALPREKMQIGLDPNRRIEEPETIGVLQLADLVARSAEKRRDVFMVIDTALNADISFGAGKSQLMLQVLDETYNRLGKKFDFRHDVVYAEDHVRFRKLLTDKTPLSPFGVDELDQFAYAREAMKGENKETMQDLKRTRKWGRPIVGCCGSLWQLDPFLRDIKITHRIRIEYWDDENYRGRATVWRKGGFSVQPEDRWGKWPPEFPMEFSGIPAEAFQRYHQCALLAEESGSGGMDKFLAKNSRWLDERPEVVTPSADLSGLALNP